MQKRHGWKLCSVAFAAVAAVSFAGCGGSNSNGLLGGGNPPVNTVNGGVKVLKSPVE